MTKKLATDFKNDILFKFLLSDDQDEDSLYLLKLIIENTLHIKCQSIQVVNPELVPEHVGDKAMILDVKVVTDTGDIIDIEMQSSSFTKIFIIVFSFMVQRVWPNKRKEEKRTMSVVFIMFHRLLLLMISTVEIWNWLTVMKVEIKEGYWKSIT